MPTTPTEKPTDWPYLTISHGQTFCGEEILKIPEPIAERLQQFFDGNKQHFIYSPNQDVITYVGCDRVIP